MVFDQHFLLPEVVVVFNDGSAARPKLLYSKYWMCCMTLKRLAGAEAPTL